MKKLMNEFKDFALKGNVMSLAVGVIIGGAFQGIVTSLTDNILSPVIGLFTKQNFDALQVDIFGTTLKYGAFITSVINFIIMAFVVFLLVKGMNKLLGANKPKTNETVAVPEAKCPYCFTSIHAETSRCPACTSRLKD